MFRYPTVRASPGFAGAKPWRCKRVYRPVGRRLIPVAEVSRLWILGLSVRQIANEIDPVKGTKFGQHSIIGVIERERRYGDPKMFPLRRSADDMEPDPGISDNVMRQLGL